MHCGKQAMSLVMFVVMLGSYWSSDVFMLQHVGGSVSFSLFRSSSSHSHQTAKWGTKSNCRLFPIILRASAHKEGIFNLLLGPRLSRTNKVPVHLLFRSRPTQHETVKTLNLLLLSRQYLHLYGKASGSGLYFCFFTQVMRPKRIPWKK